MIPSPHMPYYPEKREPSGSYALELHDAPHPTASEYAAGWVADTHPEEHQLHRSQIVDVFGLANDDGEVPQYERTLLDEYERVLSRLSAPDTLQGRLGKVAMNVLTFGAYSRRANRLGGHFVRMMLKDAHKANEDIDAEHQLNEMYQLTLTDALTGIQNRRGLEVSLAEAIHRLENDEFEAVGLLYLDVDKFKEINDTFGHAFGDKILKGVARIAASRTRQALPERPGDAVARLVRTSPAADTPSGHSPAYDPALQNADPARNGGDEFVLVVPLTRPDRAPHPSRGVLQEKAPNTGEAKQQQYKGRLFGIGERIKQDLDQFLRRATGDAIPDVGVSIGVALYRQGMTAEQLIMVGDHMMYGMKHGLNLDEEEVYHEVTGNGR